MMRTVHERLVAPDTARRFAALTDGAPADALASLRIDLPAGACDWLAALPADRPWWYRARPDRREFRLGIGHAFRLETAGPQRFPALAAAHAALCRQWRHNGGGLAFCGFAFAEEAHDGWPNALLAVPAILLESLDGACTLTLTAPAGQGVIAIEEAGSRFTPRPPPARLPAAMKAAAPMPTADETADWHARVAVALRDIEGGALDKVVLARACRLPGSVPAAALLAELSAQQAGCTIFGHGEGARAFVGATPERLLRKRGRQVDAEALAGTAWLGSPALADEKNRREHAFVVRALLDALSPLCAAAPLAMPPAERPAGGVCHWRSRIAGRLREDVPLFELVRALHPTPAVGGYPPAVARAWLARTGERRAAWYSGGFGLLDADGDGEFSVALRSALLDGASVDIHAGAGIVAGSDASRELAETQAKMGAVCAALAAAGSR